MLVRIFISWSGPTSKKVALALREWLPNVVQFLDPWMSSEDIDKGARWNSDVATQLEQSNIGIICLTPDNLDSPWILFEAGALSKALDRAYVCPYLFCLDPATLRGPLLQFQAAVANKDETYKLLCTICKTLDGSYLSEMRLKAAFEHWWPSLEEVLRAIDCPEPADQVRQPIRSERELLEELLELTRNRLESRPSSAASSTSSLVQSLPAAFSNVRVAHDREIARGLINPAMFEFLGKKMRMAFLSVDNLLDIEGRFESQDFEALSTIGPQNLVVTHLSENRYDMIYDITAALSRRSSTAGFESQNPEENNQFPFFVVEDYFKLLGIRIDREALSVFSSPNSLMPSLEEIVKIVRLGTDWNDDQVSKEERKRFLNCKWILGVIDAQRQGTSHILTIFLDHAGPELESCQASFEERIVPELVSERFVTSICKGHPQALRIHYVLRLSADSNSAYLLLKRLTALAASARLIIKTEIYLVVRRESRLSIEKAVLVPSLPTDEANYRNTHIVPRLSADDRTRLIYLPQTVQRELISQYRHILEALGRLGQLKWFQDQRSEIERSVAKGLLGDDLTLLKLPHDILLNRVETVLKHFVDEEIRDEQLATWREELHIPSKSRNQLSFMERTKLAAHFLKSDSAHPELLESVKALAEAATVRNALVHGELDRITTKSLVGALVAYGNFLARWDHQFNY